MGPSGATRLAFSLGEAICLVVRCRPTPQFLIMISEGNLPKGALLARYKPSDGHYTDCFVTETPRDVPLADYVEAFYTGRLFRVERVILRLTGQGRSTDAEAKAVAIGTSSRFAAWTVEDRTTDQLLMCDAHGATRSWFKTGPSETGTKLYFGSAVVARNGDLPGPMKAFIPLHKLYSRLLLRGAVKRLGHSTFKA